jgi:hypothetical protein
MFRVFEGVVSPMAKTLLIWTGDETGAQACKVSLAI